MIKKLLSQPAKLFFILLFLAIIAAIVGGCLTFSSFPKWNIVSAKIRKFNSEEDFRKFLSQKAEEETIVRSAFPTIESKLMPELKLGSEEAGLGGTEPERYSQTNVQVVGIDEPDIVKTDGENIYLSSRFYFKPRPLLEPGIPMEIELPKSKIIPPFYSKGITKIIKAFPPEELNLLSEINEGGDLFLSNHTLILLQDKEIKAFDVKDPSNPTQQWNFQFEDKTRYLGARLYNNKLYLILSKYASPDIRCPIEIMKKEGKLIEVKCADIYYPYINFKPQNLFVILQINPSTGEIEKKTSFLGSYGSVIYMSPKALYLTYPSYIDTYQVITKFILQKASDLFDSWVIEKIQKLNSYDLSTQAKMVELTTILSQFQSSLTEKELDNFEKEIEKRFKQYLEEHKRELTKTAIVKIQAETLNIEAFGEVPGFILNQFSLDEYQGNLRIATTIGRFFLPYFGISVLWERPESVNDLYVLDSNLKIIGSLTNFGKGERIYGVRFIEDKGYIVTFREIDPFFVIDLRNPQNPQLRGELKIPGYSSYLHPINKDLILGIGKEESFVKLSLFDVSNPENPKELDKLTLEEYWSEVLQNHHAFLLDKKHQIFFLPSGRKGYIISFENNQLKLKKIIESKPIRRAIYINDYLYLIGETQIKVFDENTWNEINSLVFEEKSAVEK